MKSEAPADAPAEPAPDYWAQIPFGSAEFDEVRATVSARYIDPQIDEGRAFAAAADAALRALPVTQELLPVSFHAARKDHGDERGRLRGATRMLAPDDAFLVHTIPKLVPDETTMQPSEDEIRAARQRKAKRSRQLDEAWANAGFDRAAFDRVMAYVAATAADPQPDAERMKPYWLAAAKGYLASLDPHSTLLPKAQWDDVTAAAGDPSFVGIGVSLTQRGATTLVETPVQGQPAQLAGVRAGDVIVAVDGKDIGGLSLDAVSKRIRGAMGSEVALTVQREGESKTRRFVITRAAIAMKNVSAWLVPEHAAVGCMRVRGFVPATADDMAQAYAELEAQAGGKLRGLVLDLRDNSGGLRREGVLAADLMLESGLIVSVRGRELPDDYAAREGSFGVPLAVLVNAGTTGTAEVVASAVQGNQGGLVIGERTFGKGTIQTLWDPVAGEGYYIKLTIAQYLGPGGDTLANVGVRPDIEVPPEVGGRMPLGFREEDLSDRPEVPRASPPSPNAALAQRVMACMQRSGSAERLFEADPHPQMKYDYRLMKAADAVTCMPAAGVVSP